MFSFAALQNFSSLLRLHWYELNVKSWFGLPIMFAKDYSTHRAPGFIGTSCSQQSTKNYIICVLIF